MSVVPATGSETSLRKSPSQRFALDCDSFEKLLAAAWVLQCAHDKLRKAEAKAGLIPVEALMPLEVRDPETAALSATECASVSIPHTHAENQQDLVHPVAAEETIQEVLQPQQEISAQPNISPSPWQGTSRQRVQRRQSSSLKSKLGSAKPATRLQFAFRISPSVRAICTAVLATPLWLLAMVAALMLIETGRHDLSYSAQATSTRDIPHDDRRSENPALQPAKNMHEISHMRSTDAAALATLQELSPFEVNGLRRQARYGDASAAFTLGMAFEMGRYMHQSCLDAAHWVAVAAEDGDAAAQYNLGLRYRDGDGVPVNRTIAEKWLRQAAARNHNALAALKNLASN